MVKPSLRKAKKTKRAGGIVKYKPKKPAKASCGLCGAQLHAVPHRSTAGMRALAKTKKRPERPFGGVLCSKCSTSLYKTKARGGQPRISQQRFFKQLK
ncbi:MAG: 50S ribosomal protein L34e [Candidatus Micrarchaeota archaeon]